MVADQVSARAAPRHAAGERLFDEPYDARGLRVENGRLVDTGGSANLDDERVTVAELRLEKLRTAETLKLIVDHDDHTDAQCLPFLQLHSALHAIIS